MYDYMYWYHSQDWINEGPTVEGLDRSKDHKWPRPERFRIHSQGGEGAQAPRPGRGRRKKTQPKKQAPLSGECKVCRRCEQLLTIEHFRVIHDKSRKNERYSTVCRACEREYSRIYRSRIQRGVYLAPKVTKLNVIPSIT